MKGVSSKSNSSIPATSVLWHTYTHMLTKAHVDTKNTRMHTYGRTLTHAWLHTPTHTHTVHLSLSPSHCHHCGSVCKKICDASHNTHARLHFQLNTRYIAHFYALWTLQTLQEQLKCPGRCTIQEASGLISMFLSTWGGTIKTQEVLLCQPPKLEQEPGCSWLQLAGWGITVNCI